ncbi:YitT family protein [Helicovermis profundi]|uniref:YitT family protein n=1 Tax=Helicovermis profundi TaxID=3065157 RepID=A0AAU9E913_9FIRM|nr:YitT family protein [Clostridia bacterium S502]
MKNTKIILNYLVLMIGTFILAVGLYLFLIPNVIAPGGVTGLAIVIKKIIGIDVWISNLVINIPLFILGVIILGKKAGIKTAFGTLSLSVFLILIEKFFGNTSATHDLLLASIFGGISTGFGIGLVFRSGGTTGGTDLAGSILHKFFPNLSIAKLMMVIDLCIVVTAGIVNKSVETSLYSMISLYVIVKVADFIVEGLDYSKSFYIVTDYPEDISKAIIDKLGRGVTSFYAQGMYTGKDKRVLMCVVNRTQVSKLKDIVHEIDIKAFMMVSTTHEVLGEGFREIVK